MPPWVKGALILSLASGCSSKDSAEDIFQQGTERLEEDTYGFNPEEGGEEFPTADAFGDPTSLPTAGQGPWLDEAQESTWQVPASPSTPPASSLDMNAPQQEPWGLATGFSATTSQPFGNEAPPTNFWGLGQTPAPSISQPQAVAQGSWELTGRTSMSDRFRNACGIQYNPSGLESVGSEQLPIVGIDTLNFHSNMGTSPGEWNGKQTSPVCGQIAEVTFPTGQTQRFVVADRIPENERHSQLDVSRWYYNNPNGGMRSNNVPSTSNVRFTGEVATGLQCADWVLQPGKYYNQYCANR